MKHSNLQSKIIAARPEDAGNANFVKNTMLAIKSSATNETFSNAIRTMNTTKQGVFKMNFEKLKWKFSHLSTAGLIAVAIASALLVSGTAYATYKLLGPIINITERSVNSEDQKRLYTIDISNCGKIVGGTPIGNGLQYFEVARNSNLSEEQIKKVLHDTCEYQAITEFSQKHWEQSFDQRTHYKKGDVIKTYGFWDQGQYGIGKVKSLDSKSISIEVTTYEGLVDVSKNQSYSSAPKPNYYPGGKRNIETHKLSPELEVWQDGQMTKIDQIKPGDTVYLHTLNEVIAERDINFDQVGQTVHNPAMGETSVIGIIKANLDTRYVQAFPFIGDPSIVGPITQLVGCQGTESKEFLCVSTNSTHLRGMRVYAVQALTEISPDQGNVEKGDEYYRKDIPNDKINETIIHEIEGRILSIDERRITLRTRGKSELVQINLPYDVVASYNQNNTVKLETGDYIEVYYEQYQDENELIVKPGDISSITYLNYMQPDGSLKKY